MQHIRTPGTPDVALTAGDKAYIDHVTPYAFKQICKQLALRDSVKLAADGSGRLHQTVSSSLQRRRATVRSRSRGRCHVGTSLPSGKGKACRRLN